MAGYYVDDMIPNTHSKEFWPTAAQGGYFNAIAHVIDVNYANRYQRWDVWYVDPAHYVEWRPANRNVPERRYYFRFMKVRQPLPAHILIRCTRETSTAVPEILRPGPPEDR
jgi:hypothetical protein